MAPIVAESVGCWLLCWEGILLRRGIRKSPQIKLQILDLFRHFNKDFPPMVTTIRCSRTLRRTQRKRPRNRALSAPHSNSRESPWATDCSVLNGDTTPYIHYTRAMANARPREHLLAWLAGDSCSLLLAGPPSALPQRCARRWRSREVMAVRREAEQRSTNPRLMAWRCCCRRWHLMIGGGDDVSLRANNCAGISLSLTVPGCESRCYLG